ncbi:MAG: hypothetical protein ABL966_07150 [Acidimicrobiales bacterium]
MRARVWWRGGVAVAVALLAVGSLGLTTPAGARPAAACPAGDGITVMVDFGPLGGGVQIRCVTQSVTSGFDALTKAGFSFTRTQRFGGLLCRIDAKPADEPCVNAPPSDRYWAYWTADEPGGAWTYSDAGGGNRVPPPGSVEGWAFSEGCDRTPGSGPCPSAATTTTTTTPVPPTTSDGSASPTSTTAAPVAPAAPGDTRTTSTTAADGSTSTTAAPGERAPEPGQEGDEEVALGVGPAAATSDDAGDGGSAAGAVIGGLAVLAVGGAGAVTARRRRTTEGSVG